MAVKNLIFDFDGTLMDTAPAILSKMHETIALMDLPKRSDAQLRSAIGFRLEDMPRQLFPELEVDGKLFATTYRHLFAQISPLDAATPFPGVIATLRSLRGHGFGIAIATSRSRSSLIALLDAHNLLDLFDALVAGDDVALGKPNPDPVLVILRKTGWNPEECITVGDAGVDILMGCAAGTSTCGVTYGNGTREELTRAGANHLIDNFYEIANIVLQ